MAKLDSFDDIGKPGKPIKHRGFPWRLWLYALVMTGAAGAGGYFVYDFKQKADAGAACTGELDDQKKATEAQKGETDKALRAGQDCKAASDAAATRTRSIEQQNDQLSKNLNATKDELSALRAQRAEAERRVAAIEEIQKQFAKMIDTGALKVASRRGSLVLSLPAEVLFPSGVADLSDDGKLKVLEVGLTLKRFPDRRFLVVGHSDTQALPKGSLYKDNWELSTARALTVTRFLVQAGMDSKNLLPAGAGEHDPISPKELARNRRIEILLLPAINELPPLPASLTEAKPDGKAEPKPDGKAEPKP